MLIILFNTQGTTKWCKNGFYITIYSNKEDMKFICKLNLQHNKYIQYI